jgi:glyceraldehyde 3-phosphate dehydrogenase
MEKTKIGINGFGRIGKCIFLQLLKEPTIEVTAINIPDSDTKYFETYIKYDSTHKYDNNFDIKVINDNEILFNNKKISILKNRNASELNWKDFGINYVIDATGVYLTQEKAKMHNVDYIIMCSPPKDNTPTFVYGGNHEKYSGEKIISNASCTTNCIVPVLKLLDEKYLIKKCNFTTIHATTASQTTADNHNVKSRINRAILNNIIPHTTGASSSIYEVLPNLKNKIKGTSLRVPVSNVSIVDINIELEKESKFEEILGYLENSSEIIKINKLNLVSSDFMSSIYPSIIDKSASIDLDNNSYKLMIWYDNEWSYSAQVIRLLKHIIEFNKL